VVQHQLLFLLPELCFAEPYALTLTDQRDSLSDLSNVLTYATFVETEKAGYLIRQYAGASLYDRIR
jgi:phosphoinositide-3-kinase regulatory subunit 4